MAFSSATHDIAADGFTCWGWTPRSRRLCGVRVLFIALPLLPPKADWCLWPVCWKLWLSGSEGWSLSFIGVAAVFLALFIYHFFVLPRPAADVSAPWDNQKISFGIFPHSDPVFPAQEYSYHHLLFSILPLC